MIQFKLNNKSIQVCSSWDDFDFNQFYETFNLDSDILKLVSLCSRLDYEIIKNARIEGEVERLIQAVSFIKTPAKWDEPVLQCGKFRLPINHKGQYNIQFESLAQFEDMRVIIQGLQGKSAKDLSEKYPDIVAIYLQKIRDGEYDPNKAQEMVSEIRLMPAREVVTLGSFFLVKVSTLLTGMQASSRNIVQNQKKSKQVTKGFKKHSAHSQRSLKSR